MRIFCGFLLVLAGCDIPPPDFWAISTGAVFTSGQGTTTTSGGLSAIAIWTSDAPVDGADHVWITFDRVALIRDGRTTVVEDGRRTLDMLELQHGVRRQLAAGVVAPGTYDALRVELAASNGFTHRIEIDGKTHPLVLAPGAESALEFEAQYRMRPNEALELQVDFNVRLSIYELNGMWYLDPTGFLHDPLNAGSIEGTALPAGSIVSAQASEGELASAKSGPDGYFRITPMKPGRYDLVVTRAGYAPAFEAQVSVDRATTSRGHHFLLDPAEPGSIHGTYLAFHSPGITLRLIFNGKFLGFSGVDPQTGAFSFPDVPPGALEIEAWDSYGPLGRRENVLVGSGFDAFIEFR